MRLLLAIIPILLCSCWARLPSRGPEPVNALVGKTAELNQTIYIDGGYGFTKKDNLRQVSSGNIRILNPRQKVQVTSIVSRRLPNGLHYYIVLTTLPDRDMHFDYPIYGDGLTYDDVFIWKKQAEQGAAANP